MLIPTPSHHEEAKRHHGDHDGREYPPKAVTKTCAGKHVYHLLLTL
jgi:hypothetical protein